MVLCAAGGAQAARCWRSRIGNWSRGASCQPRRFRSLEAGRGARRVRRRGQRDRHVARAAFRTEDADGLLRDRADEGPAVRAIPKSSCAFRRPCRTGRTCSPWRVEMTTYERGTFYVAKVAAVAAGDEHGGSRWDRGAGRAAGTCRAPGAAGAAGPAGPAGPAGAAGPAGRLGRKVRRSSRSSGFGGTAGAGRASGCWQALLEHLVRLDCPAHRAGRAGRSGGRAGWLRGRLGRTACSLRVREQHRLCRRLPLVLMASCRSAVASSP